MNNPYRSLHERPLISLKKSYGHRLSHFLNIFERRYYVVEIVSPFKQSDGVSSFSPYAKDSQHYVYYECMICLETGPAFDPDTLGDQGGGLLKLFDACDDIVTALARQAIVNQLGHKSPLFIPIGSHWNI